MKHLFSDRLCRTEFYKDHDDGMCFKRAMIIANLPASRLKLVEVREVCVDPLVNVAH